MPRECGSSRGPRGPDRAKLKMGRICRTGQLASWPGDVEPKSTASRSFPAKTAALPPISPRFSRFGRPCKLAQWGGLWQISARLVGPSGGRFLSQQMLP
jgi:hypothetical protein